jgi:N-acetylmuramoyl-L-alanine amidase
MFFQEMIKIIKDKKFTDFFEQKNSRNIDFLVLHHIAANSPDHAILQLLKHQVSSHFLIDEVGNIFELVDENNIAYHGGVSYFRGFDGLNKNSIGVEFINSSPFTKKFEVLQMQAGVALCQYLIAKYNIKKQNIVGHSDIAYNSENGFLDRKQDPSHLFDWAFLAKNNISVYPKISLSYQNDQLLFGTKDKSPKIKNIKQKLAKFGYKVNNFNDEFDLEMEALTRVFHRRFNQEKFEGNSNPSFLYSSSEEILNKLI